MIDTIVFDIGNVLAAFDWVKFVKGFGYGEDVNKDIAEAVFMSRDWPQVDLGILSDEELIAGFVKNAPHRKKEIESIFAKWQYFVEEYPFSEEWVKGLKEKGYKVYVLSNYGRTMFGFAKERFAFLRHVDGGVISYQINKIKPDPEIYKTLIDKYSITPENAVFLDDLPANLKGAEAFGFNTVLVTDHAAAVEGLKKLGVE
ncbi:MAG: HAD family hydrolase [Clostridia bacterium]